MITKIDKLEKCSKEKIEMVKWLHREKVIEVLKMRGCIYNIRFYLDRLLTIYLLME